MIDEWNLPPVEAREIAGFLCDLYWPSHQFIGIPGGASKDFKEACTALGIDVVDLPETPSETIPDILKTCFEGGI